MDSSPSWPSPVTHRDDVDVDNFDKPVVENTTDTVH